MDDARGKHLYIMACDLFPDALKIGRSDDPASRAVGLGAGMPLTVRVVAVFPCLGHLESILHKAFVDRRVETGSGREWFDVGLTTVLSKLEPLMKAYDEAETCEVKRVRAMEAELFLAKAEVVAQKKRKNQEEERKAEERKKAREAALEAKHNDAREVALEAKKRAALEEKRSSEEAVQRETKRFIEECIEAAPKASDATLARELRRALLTRVPTLEKAVGPALRAAGFVERRSQCGRLVYVYASGPAQGKTARIKSVGEAILANADLDAFVAHRVQWTQCAAEASTATEVRSALSTISGLDKKSAAARLAAAGFAEGLAHYSGAQKRTTKRTYSCAFSKPTRYVRLKLVAG